MWKCENCQKRNSNNYKICIYCYAYNKKNKQDELKATEKLEYCKLCKKSIFDANKGIICSLTNDKPKFKITCNEFIIKQNELEKINIEKRKLEGNEYEGANSKKSNNWIITLFGALSYVLAKYVIFPDGQSFLTGTLSFVVGGFLGYLFLQSLKD